MVTAMIFQRGAASPEPPGLLSPLEIYIASFRQIEKLGIRTVAFLDEKFPALDLAPCVTVVRTTVDKLETFALVGHKLPAERNEKKDTLDYLTIQNAKTELVVKALEMTGAQKAAWIDMGVCRMLRDKATLERLRHIGECPDGITIPSKWTKPTNCLCPVSWRFLGAFFAGDRESLLRFRKVHVEAIRSVAPDISWEVNLWAKCEKDLNFAFNRFRADFDDSALYFPTAPAPVLGAEMICSKLRALRDRSDWKTSAGLFSALVSDRRAFERLDANERYTVLDEGYIANYRLGNVAECRRILAMFALVRVDAHIVANSNFLFDSLRKEGYRIVGTCDPAREPKKGEIVISFGSYPFCRDCLPWSDKVLRHASMWRDVRLDAFESDPCWDAMSQIYIINLDTRRDRLTDVMVELSRMGAPLDRVRRFSAVVLSEAQPASIRGSYACSASHIAVLRDFLEQPEFRNVLVMEDDVIFTTHGEKHKRDLAEFFRRRYDYDVCLINARFDMELEPFDDLLNLCFQACTTRSGYILSRQGGEKLLPVWVRGNEMLAKTLVPAKWAGDRCWSELEKDRKFFVFAERFGYQRIGFNNLGLNSSGTDEKAARDYFF